MGDDAGEWLSVKRTAELYNRLVHSRGVPTLRAVSLHKVRDMCRTGALQAQGIPVLRTDIEWLIDRTALCRVIFENAAWTFARAAGELGLSEEEYCAKVRAVTELFREESGE